MNSLGRAMLKDQVSLAVACGGSYTTYYTTPGGAILKTQV